MTLIRRLFSIFDKRGKTQLVLLFFVLLLGVGLEIVGVGSILPFISIIIDENSLQKYSALYSVYKYFGFVNYSQFVLFTCAILMLIFVLKNVGLVAIKYLQIRFINNKGVVLSRQLLTAYFYKDYSFHLQRNSSNLLRNLLSAVDITLGSIVLNLYMMLNEILVTISIVIVLFLVDPFSTIFVTVFAVGVLMAFFRLIKQRIDYYGKTNPIVYADMIKWVNQGLGGIKETKVLGREAFFLNEFVKNKMVYARIDMFARLVAAVPRYFIEIVVIAAMVMIIVVNILSGNDLTVIMPALGVFAVAAFRILPSLNNFFALLTNFKFGLPYLDLIYDDLLEARALAADGSQPRMDGNAIMNQSGFQKSIMLSGVSFKYFGSKDYVLEDVNLEIMRGQSVGFVGTTGAGKTTLIDIILGLLEPEKGRVLVDGNDIKEDYSHWQRQIGYIPQSIYLSDDTIRNNIAFGLPVELIEDAQVWRSLETAQLDSFVRELPDGLDTVIGERGVCISGGQRQRIGIARALYHNPSVLVMDEATSSLDNETEKFFIDAIDRMSSEKTILIIAHRLTTIEKCDVVFNIDNAKASRIAV